MSEKVDISGLINLREFQAQDYDELNNLWEKTGVGGIHRGDNLTVIEKTISNGGKLFLLEEISSHKIIGSAWLTHDFRRIYLHHFCIHDLFQGKGLAHLLCKKCITFAEEMNMQIKLEVHNTNSKAIALYEKHGFKFLGDYLVYIIRKTSKL